MKCPLHPSLLVAFSFLQLHAFAQPAKVSIVEPEAGQQITGNIQVKVAVEGDPIPTSMYVGLGKLNWQEMEQVDSSGEWIGTINSTLVPNGQQVLRTLTDNKKVSAEQNAKVENPIKVFFSDLHSHCGYSDGVLVPAVAHEYAQDIAKLDIFCLTDHLEHVDDAEWIDMREAAWDANQDGELKGEDQRHGECRPHRGAGGQARRPDGADILRLDVLVAHDKQQPAEARHRHHLHQIHEGEDDQDHDGPGKNVCPA